MSNDDQNNSNGNGNGNGFTSSWSLWQRLVLSEIKRLDEAVKTLQKEKEDILIRIAVLQTKAVIFGGVAGAILAAIAEFIMYISLAHVGASPK